MKEMLLKMEITMTKLQELQGKILEAEDAAGLVNPEEYETLYKILVKAYYYAKDIIALQDPINVMLEDVNTDILQDELDTAKAELVQRDKTIISLNEEVDVLITSIASFSSKMEAITKLSAYASE